MEVSDELALEVSPASVSARRASMSVTRASFGIDHGSNAALLTAQLRQGVRLKAEAYADMLQNKWFKKENGDSPGYYGRWWFYKPASADDDDQDKSFTCLRTYATAISDDGLPEITICNVHDGSAAFGQPQERQQDGLQQNTFRRLLSDPYFSCSLMKLDELEEAEGLHACCFRRSVPLVGTDLEVAARVPPVLPPGRGRVGAHGGEWGAQNAAGGRSPKAWGFEVLIEDADNRWSLAPLFSMDSLELISHIFVQARPFRSCVWLLLSSRSPCRHLLKEHKIDVNLDEAIDMAAMPRSDQRPRLAAAPQLWMEGLWTGQLIDIVWDEDGEMVRLPPRLAVWAPPDAKRANYQLQLYPDAMYGFFPRSLPDVEQLGVRADFQSLIRFEVGGMMRSEQLFRRIILRYSPTGEIQSISVESYRPIES